MRGSRPALLAATLHVAAIGLLLLALSETRASGQAPSTTTAPVATPSASATATATPAAAIDTGDPRSDGQGPGLVGDPLAVLLGVVVIGVATVVVTAVVARATGRA